MEETSAGGQDQFPVVCGMRASTARTFLFALRTTSGYPDPADLASAKLLLGRLRVRGRPLATGLQHQSHHQLPQLLPSGYSRTIRALRRRHQRSRSEMTMNPPGIYFPGRGNRHPILRFFGCCRRRSRSPHRPLIACVCGSLLHLRFMLRRISSRSWQSSRRIEPFLAIIHRSLRSLESRRHLNRHHAGRQSELDPRRRYCLRNRTVHDHQLSAPGRNGHQGRRGNGQLSRA